MRRRYAFDEAKEVAKILGDWSPTYSGKTKKEGKHAFVWDEWEAQWKVDGHWVHTLVDDGNFMGLVGQIATLYPGDELKSFANKYNLAIDASESSEATGSDTTLDGVELLESFNSQFDIELVTPTTADRFWLDFIIRGEWDTEWGQGGKGSCYGSIFAFASFMPEDEDGDGDDGAYEVGSTYDIYHSFNLKTDESELIVAAFISTMEKFIAEAKVEFSKKYAIKEAMIQEKLRKAQAEKMEILSLLGG